MDSEAGESGCSSKKMKIDSGEAMEIRGFVVLAKKAFLGEVNDCKASIVDRFDELIGHKISLRLVSAVNSDPTAEDKRGKMGKPACLEQWVSKLTSLTAGDSTFAVSFEWEEAVGVPGAFLISNAHHAEFYIRTLTLEDVPGHGRIHFVCNSWIYPSECYNKDRIFFSNQTYLPDQMPEPLRYYREEELRTLRGDGTGKREEWDRVYDYDVYNDLSRPDKGPEHVRPIFGGPDRPYPRRGRTGRPPTETDPKHESRVPLLESLNIYVPRDERFSRMKMSDVVAYGLKLGSQALIPGFKAMFDKLSDAFFGLVERALKHKLEALPNKKSDGFESFEEILRLYQGGLKVPMSSLMECIREKIPSEMFRELCRSDGEGLSEFPKPQVIQSDELAWGTDEEFARQMLAGVNPVLIRRLEEFPPKSKLDPQAYGNQNSTMKEEHIRDQLGGLHVDEAIESGKLFILDHHDPLIPFLRLINETSTKTYATRTLFFLQDDGALKLLAIELSLPHPEGDQSGIVSMVRTPAARGAEGTIWQLAKAYVSVNDSGYHQLICHWLHTHAAMEPFVIAANRQLSVVHPIHKLLKPHFRDTMNINALARQTLINANGLLEMTVFPAKYSIEMTAAMYNEWVFPKQALPADLIERGMAVEDPTSRHGLRLLIEDYPYAIDGLEIWSAIRAWVDEYCRYYYGSAGAVQDDTELQAWWEEVRTVGHGDKKGEPWWPTMQSLDELIDTCSTIIWIASALHAAVNFGQYPYGGYVPNRPAMSRRLLPNPNTPDYEELESNPERAFLKTVTPQAEGILGISLVEVLSRHSSDEVYLGQRDTPEWTADEKALEAFGRFGKRLSEVEKRIDEMNEEGCKGRRWKNRVGPAKVPYTLLYPSSEIGLTGKGIPNSVSI